MTWECEDSIYGGKTLIEFEYFSLDGTTYGFVLYDGGDEGELTHYSRQGLDRRWDWGENGQYSFVITPDGNGRYYDFYKCSCWRIYKTCWYLQSI